MTGDPQDLQAAKAQAIAGKLLSDAKKSFPWYDAVWLRQFVAAARFIEVLKPQLTEEFLQAFEPLRTAPNFSVHTVPHLFSDDVLEEIREVVKTLERDRLEGHETKRFGRDVLHNNAAFTELQGRLLALVRDLAGEEVEASYNFLSLYGSTGVCEPHLDAPSAKWTLDVCIDQDRPWPIQFSQVVDWPDQHGAMPADWQSAIKQSSLLRFDAVTLEPNDAVFFSGSSQWHYRDPIPATAPNSFATLLFFHFIPRGMAALVQPRNWPELFDFPELGYIVAARGNPRLQR